MSTYVPEPGGEPQNFEELSAYIQRELSKISATIDSLLPKELEELHSEPLRKRELMIVVADGTDWDPGEGRGVYIWAGGQWNLISLTLPPRTDTTPPPPPPPGGGDPTVPSDPVVAGIAPSSFSIDEGGQVTYTVTLDKAPTVNTLVTLANSNNAVATIPSSVTVLAGQLSAEFVAATIQQGSATFSATLNGVTRNATLTINDVAPPPDPELPPEGGTAVPTFHCCSLYWTPPSPPSGDAVVVEFRVAGTSTWHRGLDMWYDQRNNEARGSLVHLEPNTTYEVQFSLSAGSPLASLTFKTWSEVFNETPMLLPFTGGSESNPRTTLVTAGFAPGTTTPLRCVLDINESGSINPDGTINYKVWDFTGTNTWIRAPNSNWHWGVVIRANYVILRGLNIRGGEDGILLLPGTQGVVIERNDIADWGVSTGIFSQPMNNYIGKNETGGIRQPYPGSSSWNQAPNSRRYVIQYNKVHDPAFGTTGWDIDQQTGNLLSSGQEHPYGPNAIALGQTGGNHVIRYNEIYSGSMGKWYNDGLGGGSNFSSQGFPGPDSDIYGNSIKNVMDDAIEAEGGGRNVRIFQNYIDETAIAIASTVVHWGPLYIFRNVSDRQRFYNFRGTADSDGRAQAYKSGRSGSFGDGRRYFIHNTTLQRDNPEGSQGLGCGNGAAGNTNQNMTNTRSYNNLWHSRHYNHYSLYCHASSGADNVKTINDMGNGRLGNFSSSDITDFDRFNWQGDGRNPDTTLPELTFKSGHGPGFMGKWQLEPGTVGHDTAVTLFNFNDARSRWPAIGGAADRGAHEEGSEDMTFGLLSNAR